MPISSRLGANMWGDQLNEGGVRSTKQIVEPHKKDSDVVTQIGKTLPIGLATQGQFLEWRLFNFDWFGKSQAVL